MTKKDYIKIADMFVYKLDQVRQYKNFNEKLNCTSLLLAVIEDFVAIAKADNIRFNKEMFIAYINKHTKGEEQLSIG